jgi:hypothetical protein
MISAEGERVRFDRPFECVGPVEEWLEGLIEATRDTVRTRIADAVASFREVARGRWVETYPAQALLVAAQAMWAVDVEAAFGKREEGHETVMAELLAEVHNCAAIGPHQGAPPSALHPNPLVSFLLPFPAHVSSPISPLQAKRKIDFRDPPASGALGRDAV